MWAMPMRHAGPTRPHNVDSGIISLTFAASLLTNSHSHDTVL